MTPQRKRRAAWQAEYKEASERVVTRSQGRCEIRTGVCAGRASQVHHKRRRTHPEANALENLAAVCEPCHTYLHAHPAESYENGWLIHYESHDVLPAVYPARSWPWLDDGPVPGEVVVCGAAGDPSPDDREDT